MAIRAGRRLASGAHWAGHLEDAVAAERDTTPAAELVTRHPVIVARRRIDDQ